MALSVCRGGGLTAIGMPNRSEISFKAFSGRGRVVEGSDSFGKSSPPLIFKPK